MKLGRLPGNAAPRYLLRRTTLRRGVQPRQKVSVKRFPSPLAGLRFFGDMQVGCASASCWRAIKRKTSISVCAGEKPPSSVAARIASFLRGSTEARIADGAFFDQGISGGCDEHRACQIFGSVHFGRPRGPANGRPNSSSSRARKFHALQAGPIPGSRSNCEDRPKQSAMRLRCRVSVSKRAQHLQARVRRPLAVRSS